MQDKVYDFGIILKELRAKKKMTQKKLADSLELTVGAVSKYETGESLPPFEVVRSLSAIFNVSTDYLYGYEPKDKISTYGLTDTQAEIIRNLTDMFRDGVHTIGRQITTEQSVILGQIVAEFLK